MMSSYIWRVAALAAVIAALGCSVDRNILVTESFRCTSDSECVAGFGCVAAEPYTHSFCAPRCDAMSCSGVCIEHTNGSFCLESCRIDDNGTASACQTAGFNCVNPRNDGNDGVCYPVASCRTSDDCVDEKVCTSELEPEPNGRGYYCVPRASAENDCPARSFSMQLESGSQICLAECAPPDLRCPVGFGCLHQFSVVQSDHVLCFPGLYGVPCTDDASCLEGRCLTGRGGNKLCSLSCDDASRFFGGCDNVASLADLSSALHFECDTSLPSPICSMRSGIGFTCTTPESDAYVCADGLECRTFAGNGETLRYCTKACSSDGACTSTGGSSVACFGMGANAMCLPKRPTGRTCDRPQQCISGQCISGKCT